MKAVRDTVWDFLGKLPVPADDLHDAGPTPGYNLACICNHRGYLFRVLCLPTYVLPKVMFITGNCAGPSDLWLGRVVVLQNLGSEVFDGSLKMVCSQESIKTLHGATS